MDVSCSLGVPSWNSLIRDTAVMDVSINVQPTITDLSIWLREMRLTNATAVNPKPD